MSPSKAPPSTSSGDIYLPDFCSTRTVFLVVLVAELFAIMLTLASAPASGTFWTSLADTSFFLLWTTLACAATLCFARPHLARYSVAQVSAISLVLLLATTGLISEAVYWLGRYWAGPVGAFETRFPSDHWTFVLRNLSICLIISALLLRYFYVTYEWKRNVEEEARSRIHALQARIRPHFLFNSMNTIAALTRSDPTQAEEAVEDLADLFRATLTDSRSNIRIKEELEVARIYQRIEQLRLGERLLVEWDVGDLPMRAYVPSLTIQPLLENAIYHGIEPRPEGGTVRISGRCANGEIHVTVTNPLPEDSAMAEREGNRLALANIRQRLELAYEGRAKLDVENRGGEYRVSLSFPYAE